MPGLDDFLDGIVVGEGTTETRGVDTENETFVDGDVVEVPIVPGYGDESPRSILSGSDSITADAGNDDEDENEDEDTESQSSGADNDTENEYYLRGLLYKEQGIFSKAVDVPKDIDAIGLEDLYKSQIEANAIAQIRTEIQDRIRAKGIDPEEIFGTDPVTVSETLRTQYEAIGKMTYDEIVDKSDDVAGTLNALATEYVFATGGGRLNEDQIKVLVNAELSETTEIEAFEKFRKFFQDEAVALKAAADKTREETAKAEKEKAAADAAAIKKILGSGEVGGKKLSSSEIDAVLTALTVKNHIYDDGKGTRRRVSLYEKKKLEAASDLKKNLAMALYLIGGMDAGEADKERVRNQTTLSVMERIAKATAGVAAPSAGKSTTNKNKTNADIRALESLILPD